VSKILKPYGHIKAKQCTARIEEGAIYTVLDAYRNAVNISDVRTILPLYADDAALMGENAPIQLGSEAIRSWYQRAFDSICLDVDIYIEDVCLISEVNAFARMTARGSIKTKSTGQISKATSHEVLMMRRFEGEWKIAQHCFGSTDPQKCSMWEHASLASEEEARPFDRLQEIPVSSAA
jgi:ketosteroid isomerase-like protein